MHPRFTLTSALGLGFLLVTGAQTNAIAKDGYTNTPFVKDVNWNIRDAAGKPQTKDSPWHVHDPNRPNPVKVAGGTYLTTKPPADADVLFDGTQESIDKNWDGQGRKKLWRVKENTDYIVADSNNIVTKKNYSDAQFHIEWRVPADRKCGGQGGANSGVLFMGGQYEIQILESHTNETYADGQAGAIYDQFPPLVNAARPKGEWQSYDITFTAPRFDKDGKLLAPAFFTVLHNGIVVQANQPLNGPTDWRGANFYRRHPDRLPILLQFHGDPIEFRNIWVRDLAAIKETQEKANAAALEALKAKEKKPEPKKLDGMHGVPKVKGTLQATPPPAGADILFDGTPETAAAKWVPENKGRQLWPVKDGIWIDSNGTDVLTKKEYGSCKVHIEWRVPADRKGISGQRGANSGVIFMPKKGWYEVQILESHSNPGNTYADGMAGAIYQRSVPSVNPSLPKGEWQSYDITFLAPKFEGNKVLRKPTFTLVYNGVTVQKDVAVNGSTLSRKATLSPHPVKQPFKLQFHGDPIEFRNIWVEEIKD
ncbi:MAG: DUF1080 domain-containing protein [Puniceicoccales bacterium]|jgi:hypothetical protein|nr:DUF1080 domain-containing protein [Puniceicoccales bacterium]